MTQTILDTLPVWQLLLVGLFFLWSGIVRSGLGFGGAALSLPLLLMIVEEPLLFLPSICVQLLLFSVLTVATRLGNVNWQFLARMCFYLALPVAAGLFGLLNLPGILLSSVVYGITLFYGIAFALDRMLESNNRFMDFTFTAIGGYVSGVSLTGAPLLAAVAARRLPVTQLRDTLFVLWFVLVVVKLATFSVQHVPMNWRLTLLTFPLVTVGHFIGLSVHDRLARGNTALLKRIVGVGLAMVSSIGIVSLLVKSL